MGPRFPMLSLWFLLTWTLSADVLPADKTPERFERVKLVLKTGEKIKAKDTIINNGKLLLNEPGLQKGEIPASYLFQDMQSLRYSNTHASGRGAIAGAFFGLFAGAFLSVLAGEVPVAAHAEYYSTGKSTAILASSIAGFSGLGYLIGSRIYIDWKDLPLMKYGFR